MDRATRQIEKVGEEPRVVAMVVRLYDLARRWRVKLCGEDPSCFGYHENWKEFFFFFK